jgi:hypothetical protein
VCGLADIHDTSVAVVVCVAIASVLLSLIVVVALAIADVRRDDDDDDAVFESPLAIADVRCDDDDDDVVFESALLRLVARLLPDEAAGIVDVVGVYESTELCVDTLLPLLRGGDCDSDASARGVSCVVDSSRSRYHTLTSQTHTEHYPPM